jgi:hypothetical protein
VNYAFLTTALPSDPFCERYSLGVQPTLRLKAAAMMGVSPLCNSEIFVLAESPIWALGYWCRTPR